MIYEASASRTTGTPLEEFIRHKKETGRHHPDRNKIGKFQELALAYGGWIGAMVSFGADEFLTEPEMKTAILSWRKASPALVEMWGGQSRGEWEGRRPELFGLEGAAISAVKYPGQAFSYRQIVYQVQDDILYCQLPSKRFITYHKPRLEPSTRNYAAPWELQLSYEGWNTNPKSGAPGWVRMFIYGGKFFENVVQAVARDFQANGMLNAERAGYPIVLHSHDEFAAEVPEGCGSIEELEACANSLPEWAKLADGSPWPIKMKGGWRGKFYGKWD